MEKIFGSWKINALSLHPQSRNKRLQDQKGSLDTRTRNDAKMRRKSQWEWSAEHQKEFERLEKKVEKKLRIFLEIKKKSLPLQPV